MYDTPHEPLNFSRRRLLLMGQTGLAFGLVPTALLGTTGTAIAQTGDQREWRYCSKCGVMFWNGQSDKGRCPAGGSHSAQGYIFSLHYDSARNGADGKQYDWRFCQKCRGMFFDGYPNKGKCPSGGAHVAQGWMFGLDQRPPATQNQNNWRFCNKCQGLFFDGYPNNKGRCPGGGAHVAQGLNFHLPYRQSAMDNPGQAISDAFAALILQNKGEFERYLSGQLGRKNLVCGGCTISNNMRFGNPDFRLDKASNSFDYRMNSNYVYLRLRNDSIVGAWADPAVEVHYDLSFKGRVIISATARPRVENIVASVPRIDVSPRTATGAALTTLVRFAQMTGPGGRLIQEAHDKYLKYDATKFINEYLSKP